MACDKQLVPGDEFALRPDNGGLYCKDDHTNFDNRGLLEENNNHTNTDDAGGHDHLEDIDDEQSQDGDKDLLLLEDRLADSGK